MNKKKFSKLKLVKSKQTSRLTDDNLRALLSVATCDILLDFYGTLQIEVS